MRFLLHNYVNDSFVASHMKKFKNFFNTHVSTFKHGAEINLFQSLNYVRKREV